MSKFRRTALCAAVVVGLLAPLTPLLAAVASASTASGVPEDLLDDALSPTDHPVTDAEDLEVKAGSAPAPVQPEESESPLAGMDKAEVAESIEDRNAQAADAAPEVSYTTQSRDVRNDDGSHTIEVFPEPAFAPGDDGHWRALDATVSDSDARGVDTRPRH